jgi:hypothetical protein
MTVQQLSSLLTVMSAVITAIAAVYIYVGPGPCIALALVSFLSVACWLKFSFFSEPSREGVVTLYILVIVLNLVLNTCRYWSELPHFVAENWRSWFAPTFPITDVSWFVGFVTCPVTLMLLGGYCLVKRMPLGSYLAWWTFIYAIVDALVQIKVGVLGPNAHGYPDVAASAAATAQMVVGLLGCQRLPQEKPSRREFSYSGTTPTLRELNLWSALLVRDRKSVV